MHSPPVCKNAFHPRQAGGESTSRLDTPFANENPYLPTPQPVVHNASLSNLNHGRRAGFSVSPAAAPPIFGLRPSFRSSIVAIKYRSASIA
jgi:hypothetical protein